ncbi:MAG: hypothetical protein E4G99_05870 [Anaerolineales bacterium]|nr:MAG: hypothetical protein E4G99_05870 [Anaerolineales bacterium]
MRERVVNILWGLGLLAAIWLVHQFYLWTNVEYRAVGSGLDPRGLIPFLELIMLGIGGYKLYRGITGRDPFDPKTNVDDQNT